MKTKNYRLIEKAMHDFRILHTDTANIFDVSVCEDKYLQQVSFVWYGKQEHLQIICTCSKRKPSSNIYSVYKDDIRLFKMEDMPLHKILKDVNEWLDYIKRVVEPLIIHC